MKISNLILVLFCVMVSDVCLAQTENSLGNYVRVFDRMLPIPGSLYLDLEATKSGYVKFTNIGIFDGYQSKFPATTLVFGKIGKNFKSKNPIKRLSCDNLIIDLNYVSKNVDGNMYSFTVHDADEFIRASTASKDTLAIVLNPILLDNKTECKGLNNWLLNI